MENPDATAPIAPRPDRPRTSYFRVYKKMPNGDSVGDPVLTAYTLPFTATGFTGNLYAVGFSFCTAEDQPVKAYGRRIAQGRAEHIAEEVAAYPEILREEVTEGDGLVTKGYRVFTKREDMVAFMQELRQAEWHQTAHRARQIFRQAFFGLPTATE